jgi:hypothetical protein
MPRKETSVPTTAVAIESQVISSLRTDCRPPGTKRKATLSTIENGQGRLERAVDSVVNAIEKNGKSKGRSANLALRYRLISGAGFIDEEHQAAYRKLLADIELDGEEIDSLDVAESLRDKIST